MNAPSHLEPARFARAVRAACDSYGDAQECDYPQCDRKGRICWLRLDVKAFEAFVTEWERPQRLGNPA